MTAGTWRPGFQQLLPQGNALLRFRRATAGVGAPRPRRPREASLAPHPFCSARRQGLRGVLGREVGRGADASSAWPRSARARANPGRRPAGPGTASLCVELLPRGAVGAAGPRAAALGDRARSQARHGLPARPRPPRRARPLRRGAGAASRHARLRSARQRTHPPAGPRPPAPLPAPRRRPWLPIGRTRRDARRQPRPSSVTRRRRRWQGLVSAGDWRRRRRRLELGPQRLRAGARGGGRGVGPRRLPGRRFSSEARRCRLWGGGGPADP